MNVGVGVGVGVCVDVLVGVCVTGVPQQSVFGKFKQTVVAVHCPGNAQNCCPSQAFD